MIDLSPRELSAFAEIVVALETEQPRAELKEWVFRNIVSLTRSDIGSANYQVAEAKRREIRFLHDLDPATRGEYDRNFEHIDPLTAPTRARRAVTPAEQIMPYEALYRTAFYQGFLKPNGLHHGVNVFFYAGERHLADYRLWRREGARAYTEREVGILEGLSGYLRGFLLRERPGESGAALTAREHEVVQLVAKGMRDRDIAALLGISFSTVRTHINRAFDKTGAANRAELAARL